MFTTTRYFEKSNVKWLIISLNDINLYNMNPTCLLFQEANVQILFNRNRSQPDAFLGSKYMKNAGLKGRFNLGISLRD